MVKYKRKFSILSHFINHAYVKTNKQHIAILRKSRSYLSWSRETPIQIIWDFTDAFSESRARKNNVLFLKLQAAGISVVTESLFGFTKLILHHPRAVTAASRGSTIANLALRITHQPEPYILWSRFTHTLPCLTLISTVRALVCATASPVRSPAKASAILNKSVTAVTASRFSPVLVTLAWY